MHSARLWDAPISGDVPEALLAGLVVCVLFAIIGRIYNGK